MTQTPEPTAYPADYGNATIHVRMLRVMADVGAIGKGNYNEKQHFWFRGIDDAMNALQPCLVEHGVFVVPARVVSAAYEVRGTSGGGKMNVTHLEVEFTCWGAKGDSVTITAAGEAADSGDKATGKAHSMAFKVALLEAFMIRTEETARDDPDNDGTAAAGPPVQDPEIVARILAAAGYLGISPAEEYAKGAAGEDLRAAPPEALVSFCEHLEGRAQAESQRRQAQVNGQPQGQPQGAPS